MSTAPDEQVTGMPASAQTGVDAVGAYLAARITDKRRLVKALHDYVVLRLTYDEATLALRGEDRYTKRPSQEAEDVFRARTGVCEGYARLMVALGKAAGVEIAYVTGYIRDSERNVDSAASDDVVKATLEGYGHAWNAVKLDGRWELLDATWDDTSGKPDVVSSTYLFTPPKLFRFDHLPEDPAWQLVSVPLKAGEFARQPLLTPYSGELGITLEAPLRSQITVDDGEAEILLDNPFGATLTAVATRPNSKGSEARCTVEKTVGTHVAVRCALDHGQYEIRMFGSPAGSTQHYYDYFATILVNSR
jgi:transglutaminase/protease-like cytokinesis protein 3